MSLHARHAYSRDTYIRGFLEYAERFSLPDMQRRYQAFIPETELEVQRNKEMVNIFRSTLGDRSILPQQFFPLLFQATLVLPAFFRSHIHDINQLLSQFKGGLTWATAEFTKAESELWSDAGLNPSSAGYFRAFSMGPDEAGAWRNSGVFEANTAIDWKKGGFNPDSARPWIEQKIPPPLAFVWSMSQYSPEEAKALLEQGTVEPPPRSAAPTKKEKTIPVHEMPKKMSFPKKV
jgi:hypothetical protein